MLNLFIQREVLSVHERAQRCLHLLRIPDQIVSLARHPSKGITYFHFCNTGEAIASMMVGDAEYSTPRSTALLDLCVGVRNKSRMVNAIHRGLFRNRAFKKWLFADKGR